ncbi:MAG: hypothetical protein JNL62_05485 [Bryobacterales bacterium]|nr:hypothetical protein [Bryobacterales bacterium]
MMTQFLMRVAVAAILLYNATPARAGAIRMVAPSETVFVGTEFDLDIMGENLNLGGFDFVLGFNAALVGANGAEPGLGLGDASLFEAFFNSSFGLDTVQLSEVSLLSPAELLALQGSAASNSFRLARVKLQANAPGTAVFAFSEVFLTGLEASEVEADLIAAQVLIAAKPVPDPEPPPVGAPEPASTAVIGLALILVRVCARRC